MIQYVSIFSKINSAWTFKGYIKNKTNYFPSTQGSAGIHNVLVGKEGENYTLVISKGDFTGSLYKEKNSRSFFPSIILKEEEKLKEIVIENCNFNTIDALYFYKEVVRSHPDKDPAKYLEIARLIDQLGDVWYKEFKDQNRLPYRPNELYKIVDIQSEQASDNDYQAFADMLKLYIKCKKENFSKLDQYTIPELPSLCAALTIADYKSLSLAQRKHIINTLLKGDILGNYLFNNNEEGIIIRVLQNTPSEQSKDFLTFLRNDTNGNEVVIKALVNAVDDGILFVESEEITTKN